MPINTVIHSLKSTPFFHIRNMCLRAMLIVCKTMLFLLFLTPSYAIRVQVKTAYPDVKAIGFRANDTNYGAFGHSYVNDNSPIGIYSFGMRVNGILGKDIGCPTNMGMKVNLKQNTTACIIYDGNHCTTKIYSK